MFDVTFYLHIIVAGNINIQHVKLCTYELDLTHSQQ
jgi:hypothetical protein